MKEIIEYCEFKIKRHRRLAQKARLRKGDQCELGMSHDRTAERWERWLAKLKEFGPQWREGK